LQENQCTEPVVFKNSGGYGVFKQYAEQTGRGHLWKPWSEDESCSQRNVASDTLAETDAVAYCELAEVPGGGDSNGEPAGGCTDDGLEDNDNPTQASSLAGGSHAGLMVCENDDDYFELAVPEGGNLSVSISFNHDEGDLDMVLYQGEAELGVSESTGDAESLQASGGGSYTVRVYGYSGASASYSISATIN